MNQKILVVAVAIVWVGNSNGTPMHNVSGMSGAAPLWRDLMDYLHRSHASVAYRRSRLRCQGRTPAGNRRPGRESGPAPIAGNPSLTVRGMTSRCVLGRNTSLRGGSPPASYVRRAARPTSPRASRRCS
ncbi:hypothetical protein F6X40_34665 [Paraburkholderia sp. UCT31]|nr:hypothetical protein [Paraburkholderia sp. UCT31]